MMMNFLDLSAASEEERRLIREILSDTSVVNIAEPQQTSSSSPSSSSASSSQQQQPFKSNSQNHHHYQQQQQHINFSSNSNNCQQTISSNTTTTTTAAAYNSNINNNNLSSDGGLAASSSSPQIHHRNHNNYINSNTSSGGNINNNNNINSSSSSQQRKNIHNSNNINSINNISGSNNNRNNGLQNSGNVVSGVNNIHHHQQQQHYPIHYAPPLPSSDSSSTPHFHNMNVNNSNNSNINNHNSSNPSLNSQLNQQQQQQHHQNNQRTNNGQTSERLRSNLNNNNTNTSASNHINANNNTNIAVTSSTGFTPLAPQNIDQHHGNTMPLNFYNHHATSQLHHQVPSRMQTANKSDHKSGNLKSSQQYHNEVTSTSMQNTTTGAQSVPPTAQMPPIAGDMNPVIGMDMSSTQPPGYAMSPHVTAYGPPPHHVYGGPPLFQPYHYLIPYNIPPSAYMSYVLPTNPVVPTRQQVPPQSNQPLNTNASSSSHSRSHSQHMSQQPHNSEHFTTLNNNSHVNNQQQLSKDDNALKKDVTPSHQSQNMKKNFSERELPDIQKNLPATKMSTKPMNAQNDNRSLLHKSDKTKKSTQGSETLLGSDTEIEATSSSQEFDISSLDKTTKVVPSFKSGNISKTGIITIPKNKNASSNETDIQPQKVELEENLSQPKSTNSQLSNRAPQLDHSRDNVERQSRLSMINHKTSSDDTVKISSDEGFDTQSSLDLSKRSQDSTATSSDNSKPSSENCNKSRPDRIPQEPNKSNANEASSRSGGAWASSKSWADLFKRGGGDTLSGLSVNGEAEHNSGSENSDDDNRNHRLISSIKIDTTNRVNSLGRNSREQRSQEVAKRALDKMAPLLAQKISTINLKHALPFLRPRGFINKGNGCYINATLQALIACPPFYNLMKEIGDLKVTRRDNSCTPILDSFAEFFLNFPPPDLSKKNKPTPASLEQKTHISTIQAEAIEPKCIYNVLGQIKSECLKGGQEDAEEFLSSVLNGLHEEMIGLTEVLQSIQDSNARSNHQSDAEDLNDDLANDDNLWREVGPKNRSLPIRTAKVINTPIQEIFGGSLFSIRTAGKDRCGHRSPFFDLQLDISGDNVKSVQDAIKSFTATEIIHDFYCSKTKQKLDAQRRTSLDQLPPILILHLKQFVYTQDQGLKKLIKKIEYPIDFELPENCLHEKNSVDRNLLTSRSYKLLAVVYHDGKEAIKGHYLTDVFHIGSSQWIRCDDSNLRVISSPRIENPDSSRTPYLLFYRRLNTLRAQTGNHDNKKKN